MTIFNHNLSQYANMCNVLHGYQVYKGARPIDKWEFFAEFPKDAYFAATVLLQGKLTDYSVVLKDDWAKKRKALAK